MTTLSQMLEGQNNAHILFNEIVQTLSAAAIFGQKQATSVGLTWGYYGGLYVGNAVADGTLTLTDNAENYVVALRSTGVVSVSTSTTNGDDPLYTKLYHITTAGGVVTVVADQRMDTNGLLINALTDSDLTAIVTAARTVPRRTSGLESGECLATAAGVTVNTLAEGSACSVYNDSATSITLTQGSGMTLRHAGTTDTGNRTLAARGLATIWYNSATEAVVTGVGLT